MNQQPLPPVTDLHQIIQLVVTDEKPPDDQQPVYTLKFKTESAMAKLYNDLRKHFNNHRHHRRYK